ncbi:unnamed protein product [Chondrus crispus]|uniref:Uncharacterized protein n=1 Tax=Chondrus crispus TaxID=2769 RepID=R7QP57_CHOCR|nr:unnamed protein product [Chondrus crispus]CDF39874.1 unnamed protein product [Chondrus crispus]|eukprot:XP_005710168.1 unnamed protein product [Chondrus crispus]
MAIKQFPSNAGAQTQQQPICMMCGLLDRSRMCPGYGPPSIFAVEVITLRPTVTITYSTQLLAEQLAATPGHRRYSNPPAFHIIQTPASDEQQNHARDESLSSTGSIYRIGRSTGFIRRQIFALAKCGAAVAAAGASRSAATSTTTISGPRARRPQGLLGGSFDATPCLSSTNLSSSPAERLCFHRPPWTRSPVST